MSRRPNLLFLIPLVAALVAFFVTQELLYTAIFFVLGYLLMEALRFRLLPPHLHRAARLYQKGELEQALQATKQAIAASPERWETHYLQALIQFSNADLQDAEQAARNAIERKPDEAPSHLVLGQTLFAQGRYKEAQGAFDDVLRNGGKNGIDHFYAGATAYRLDNCQEALPRLELALRLGVGNPQLELLTRYYLADCLEKNGEQETAEGYLAQLRKHSKALEALRQDLRVVPDFPERTALSKDVQAIAAYVAGGPNQAVSKRS